MDRSSTPDFLADITNEPTEQQQFLPSTTTTTSQDTPKYISFDELGTDANTNFGTVPTSETTQKYKGKHGTAAFFHTIFKIAALFCYVFGTWFTEHFIVQFVVCIISLAADFWTVKNITGRLMVKLRWWNEVAEDGTSCWRYESGDPKHVHEVDSNFFWGVQLLHFGLWCFAALFCVTGLHWSWLPVSILGVGLAYANLYGYYKCRSEMKDKVKTKLQKTVTDAVFQYGSENPQYVAQGAQALFGQAATVMNVAFASFSNGPPPPRSVPAGV